MCIDSGMHAYITLVGSVHKALGLIPSTSPEKEAYVKTNISSIYFNIAPVLFLSHRQSIKLFLNSYPTWEPNSVQDRPVVNINFALIL